MRYLLDRILKCEVSCKRLETYLREFFFLFAFPSLTYIQYRVPNHFQRPWTQSGIKNVVNPINLAYFIRGANIILVGIIK